MLLLGVYYMCHAFTDIDTDMAAQIIRLLIGICERAVQYSLLNVSSPTKMTWHLDPQDLVIPVPVVQLYLLFQLQYNPSPPESCDASWSAISYSREFTKVLWSFIHLDYDSHQWIVTTKKRLESKGQRAEQGSSDLCITIAACPFT